MRWLVFNESGGVGNAPSWCWNRALGVGNVELVCVGSGGGGDIESDSW
jgi:hypothetical protein